jgi:flagellar capping protein FliD
MTSGVEMTKTKVVDMVKKYNIIVDNFSIEISYVWISHLCKQTSDGTKAVLRDSIGMQIGSFPLES